jgi:hypothetical protein
LQITLGFGYTYEKYFNEKCNCSEPKLVLPNIENLYGVNEDPLYMKTIHCLLFPDENDCKILFTKTLEKMRSLKNN